ncbi:hypothetical protein M413DRAFT_142882 [Hebeloma cylindrosporum]|uniref:Uncharacterized protein n=1 Tax=Hebeloma cylindrosporum TaxID=76867 RepID=A0A0C3CCN4_HEBCY|nr:hypothetical protein M413DRAFT_142882 [Hebeloma cylindrosporum h7]
MTAYINRSNVLGKPNERFVAIASWIRLVPLDETKGLTVKSIKMMLIYDQTLGPCLTVIEANDLDATDKWAEEQARLQKWQRFAERGAHLKWLLTHPLSSLSLALRSPASPESRRKIPTFKYNKSDESEGQLRMSPRFQRRLVFRNIQTRCICDEGVLQRAAK